jgi:hypothetical protein
MTDNILDLACLACNIQQNTEELFILTYINLLLWNVLPRPKNKKQTKKPKEKTTTTTNSNYIPAC